MINLKNITEALKNQLIAANTTNKTYIITRNAHRNEDINQAVNGWIGIYRGSVDYEPHSTGPTPWLADISLRIEMQAASIQSAQDCENRLDEIEDFVVSAIESDRTIGGKVLNLIGYGFDYPDYYDETFEVYFQESILTVTFQSKA